MKELGSETGRAINTQSLQIAGNECEAWQREDNER